MASRLGAELVRDGTRFSLWSTRARACSVAIFDGSDDIVAEHPLEARGAGHFEAEVRGASAGTRYALRLDGELFPDPYARFLPAGVHGPAEVVDTRFDWRYSTRRSGLGSGLVIYELHVGTFTPEGTYRAAAARLPELVALGVDTIELLPLAAFPGRRGWGYDGVALFAPYAPYGTPRELCELVDAAHGLGLSVLIDVVYNHFGPAGNYLRAYSPEYFTSRHQTPWGDAPDFTEPHMRRLVLDNVRYWLEDFRFDGLRLDATHAIVDDSPTHILEELAATAHALAGRPLVIAEDEHRGAATVTELGLDGFWADAFHHHVHVLLTGERDGYYARYQGTVADLAQLVALDATSHTRVVRGAPRSRVMHTEVRPEQLVYCLQNHDQVGNRALGERFHALVDAETHRAAATLLLFMPMTPLIFMGEEWAASSPFLYFTDHEPELGAAVSRGRREEFKGFASFTGPAAREHIPDPQDEATLARSRLAWEEREREPHATTLAHYRRLLELRRRDPVLSHLAQVELRAGSAGDVLWVRRGAPAGERLCLMSFARATLPLGDLLPPGDWAPRDLVSGREVHELAPRRAVILASQGRGGS